MHVRSVLVGTVLLGAVAVEGCTAEPARIFYDDSDAADSTAEDATTTSDGTQEASNADASTESTETDASVEARDSTNDANGDVGPEGGPDSLNDGALTDGDKDSGPDASADSGGDATSEVESGCGATNTIANCGACGNACDTLHSAGTSCNGVSCLYSGCMPGWGDCVTTSAPNTDGCETPLDTLTNCTGCGLTCDSLHSIGRSCDGGTCSYMGCAPGYGDCNATSAPNADGCETPITTVTDCTGCGLACDTKHSLGAACTASGCTYAGCASGWSNCNTAAPNAAGCSCNTPGCCGTTCQKTHNNGVGDLSYDCVPLGTYTQAQAMEACTAYTGDASQCVQISCVTRTDGPLICSSGNTTKNCVCWSYAGNNAGYVDNGGAPPGQNLANCFCPDPTLDPQWN